MKLARFKFEMKRSLLSHANMAESDKICSKLKIKAAVCVHPLGSGVESHTPGILVCDPTKLKFPVWVSTKVRAQQKVVRKAAATNPFFSAALCTCTRVWCAPILARSIPIPSLFFFSRRPDDPMPILLSANRNPHRGFQFQESLALDHITHPRPCKTSSVGQSVGTVNLEVVDSNPAQTQKSEDSNLHGFELHRPSSKGTKLLFKDMKAIINQIRLAVWDRTA